MTQFLSDANISKIESMTPKQLIKLQADLKKIKKYTETNRLDQYVPYPFQKSFHDAGKDNEQRLLMCSPQIGKTICGTMETTFHLTGMYPEWWTGKRFKHPVVAWSCGSTVTKVRDTLQKYLFGDPYDSEKFGTGSVPLKCLHGKEPVRKPGVPFAFESVMVKHFTDGIFDGWSRCSFKAYEMGVQVFTSEQVPIIHLDEEPPKFIMAQCLKRQLAVEATLYMTFTPEYGWTDVVLQFVNDIKPKQALIHATWEDAPHLTLEKKNQLYEALPEHIRDGARDGMPVAGEGMIFPIADELLKVDPIQLPPHWFYIAGMDVGAWSSCTAGAWIAYSRETDTMYLYDEYKAKGGTPPIHAAAFNARGTDIKIIYPHDGEKTRSFDGMGTSKVVQMYRDLGCNMHYTHFTNPPADGEEEGKGGISVDYGLYEMFDRMVTGRFKVFSTCKQWFSEKQSYHRKNGDVIRINEDIISASRYAALSIKRFGRQRMVGVRKSSTQSSNWFNPYEIAWN